MHALRDYRLRAVASEGDDPLALMLAGVQTAIRTERHAVSAVAALFPDRNLAAAIDLENAVVAAVREIDVAFLVHRGIRAKLISLSQQFPIVARFQNVVHAPIIDLFRPADGFRIILPDPAQSVRQDRATVFRNLTDLASAGLVTRRDMGDHVWRFALSREGEADHGRQHPHLLCSDCGTVICLPDVKVKITPDTKRVTVNRDCASFKAE